MEKIEKDGSFPEEYQPFLEWAKNFAAYAEYHLDQDRILQNGSDC